MAHIGISKNSWKKYLVKVLVMIYGIKTLRGLTFKKGGVFICFDLLCICF